MEQLMRFRLWCASSTAEVTLLRQVGNRHEAAMVAREVAELSRRLARTWQQALLPAHELGGVHRFGHSIFQPRLLASSEPSYPVALETRHRLARLQQSSEQTDAELLAAGSQAAVLVAERRPELEVDWFLAQQALASVLDFVEEATERLESVAEEVSFCERRRLQWDDWEALPLPPSSDGVAMIRVGGAA